MRQYQHQIEQTLSCIKERIWLPIKTINDISYKPCGYKSDNTLPSVAELMPFKSGTQLGGKDSHYWLHFTFDAPQAENGFEPWLILRTSFTDPWDGLNPQCILYLNGKMVQGFDINHTEYPLISGKKYDAYVYFYAGMHQDESFDFFAELKYLDRETEGLYYDMQVPYEALLCFDKHNEEYSVIIKHLAAASNILDLRHPGDTAYHKSVKNAREYLKTEFYEKVCKDTDAKISCIGHTHIDVAWLWTFAQTKEKAQRSFSTVLSLMKQYPEYKFMSSQPQLYQYVKEEAPELYAEIKERIAEGRFEPEGGMWLEADCNLTSGESLVRQLLFGKRFFKDEFGAENHILWLPDVFGYSAAMPQILLKSGIDSFVTSKISWNQYNMLPLDSFMWRGIDGSEIFTYFMTAQDYHKNQSPNNGTTYIGRINPSMARGTWERYQQKEYNNETIITYGFGDGGGGPTREMLEMQRRLKYGLPGIPQTQISTADEFIKRAKQSFEENCKLLNETPTWVGELYLEMHRGTYTTAVRNKKNNRRAEFLYQNAEAASIFNTIISGDEYPQKQINDGWRGILLNQFHDVIPGSSIIEVYRDSAEMYKEILKSGNEMLCDALSGIAANINTNKPYIAYNPNGFTADGVIECLGEKILVKDIPAFGWKAVDSDDAALEDTVTVSNLTTENKYYKITLDTDGSIISLYDKRNNRETVKYGKRGNELVLFEDRPYCYDAWEINEYYKHKSYGTGKAESIETFTHNAGAGFIIKKKFGNSSAIQRITLYRSLERIDIETTVDWHEEHMLLKQLFPVNVNTDKATFEIQFGNLERSTHRNTSWDHAKFEVCGHKWVDVSDGGYGVSLLNDCKYGFDVDAGTIGVTVIKAPTYPAEEIDRGESSFTVSLLPHNGNFRDGNTVKQAYLLNNPILSIPVSTSGKMPENHSMINCDNENIIIETVKKCEDDNSVIVRMYECHNTINDFTLNIGFPTKQAFICNLMENEIEDIAVNDNKINLHANGFEILTIKIIPV